MPPTPVPVPRQRPLAPSVASVMSVANDNGDNEMIPGAVHRSPGIFLTAEGSNGGPFSPNEVGRIEQNVRKGEGRK